MTLVGIPYLQFLKTTQFIQDLTAAINGEFHTFLDPIFKPFLLDFILDSPEGTCYKTPGNTHFLLESKILSRTEITPKYVKHDNTGPYG